MKIFSVLVSATMMIVLLLASTPAAQAGERLRMSPGTWLVGGSIRYDYANSESSDMKTGPAVETLDFNPSVGVFLRRGVALTASWLWMHREVGDESDNTHAGALGVLLIRGQETVQPYFGAELQFQRLSGIVDLNQVGLRLSAGLLIPLHSRLALDAGLKLSVLQGNATFDGDEINYGTAMISFGYFGIVGTFEL